MNAKAIGSVRKMKGSSMKKMTKVLLALFVLLLGVGLLFLTGIVNVSETPELYVLFPIGASLYGLFLISLVFEKQFAAADGEQSSRTQGDKVVSSSEENGPHTR